MQPPVMYRDETNHARVSLVEGLDRLTNGFRARYYRPPTLDFGESALVLRSPDPISLSCRGCTWSTEEQVGDFEVKKHYWALVELNRSSFKEAAAFLTKRYRAVVVTGAVNVPRTGAERVLGTFFTVPAPEPEPTEAA